MGYEPDKYSISYHNIFDYPLTKEESLKWRIGTAVKGKRVKVKTEYKSGYFYIKGREEIINKRLRTEKYSEQKLKIAKSVSGLLSSVLNIQFIGITGALAMNNAEKNSDIDLMIITKKNTLWLTRLIVYYTLYTKHYPLRSPGSTNERDKLCLNMWLDESDLIWPKNDRNIYTAHEIAQIVPLVNKQKTYENFLEKNKWILQFWPKAVKITKEPRKQGTKKRKQFFISSVLNFLSFKLQYLYMRKKITREVVTPTRAIFHPNDWGKRILNKLK